jgi:hypothetical protein
VLDNTFKNVSEGVGVTMGSITGKWNVLTTAHATVRSNPRLHANTNRNTMRKRLTTHLAAHLPGEKQATALLHPCARAPRCSLLRRDARAEAPPGLLLSGTYDSTGRDAFFEFVSNYLVPTLSPSNFAKFLLNISLTIQQLFWVLTTYGFFFPNRVNSLRRVLTFAASQVGREYSPARHFRKVKRSGATT